MVRDRIGAALGLAGVAGNVARVAFLYDVPAAYRPAQLEDLALSVGAALRRGRCQRGGVRRRREPAVNGAAAPPSWNS